MNPVLDWCGLGLLIAAGLWLAVASSPPMRRPRLDDRLAPYLRDTAQTVAAAGRGPRT